MRIEGALSSLQEISDKSVGVESSSYGHTFRDCTPKLRGGKIFSDGDGAFFVKLVSSVGSITALIFVGFATMAILGSVALASPEAATDLALCPGAAWALLSIGGLVVIGALVVRTIAFIRHPDEGCAEWLLGTAMCCGVGDLAE